MMELKDKTHMTVSESSELGSESVEVSITPGGDESEWVLLVSQVRAGDGSEVERLRTRLERIASKHHGDYDGWDMRVEDSSA